METDDPVAALTSKNIADRAAACRDLSRVGTVEHIDALTARAAEDKSPGVRLNASAAVADILSRCRVGSARDKLNDDQRDVYLASFGRISPVHNGGVFPMVAVLDRPKSLTILKGGLRDPRADVRLAAAVGLMRLCISVAVAEDAALEQAVVALLDDGRHHPDAVAQICRLCAAAGYRSAIPRIRQVNLSGTHQDTVLEALGILDGAESPLRGVWFSDGRDAGESNLVSPLGTAMMAFDSSGALFHDGKRWSTAGSFAPARRMFIRRSGEADARPAFQAFGRTFYAGVSIHATHTDWAVAGRATKSAARAIAAVEPALGDTAAEHRALAHLAMGAGMKERAQQSLESAISAKKTPADCWLHLADLLWASEDRPAARLHYATYIKKAKRKDDEAGMDRAKERV